MSFAGLISGPDFHYLDHLGPLCSLLNIPLIVNDEQVEELAKNYYSELEIHYITSPEYPKYIVSHFDKILSCLTKPYLDLLFFFFSKQLQSVKRIWCPHGHSDKPFSPDGLKEEDALLVYGPKMKDYLSHDKLIQVGNYRYQYFQKHFSFYKAHLDQIKEQFQKDQPIVLYAPTWEDYNDSSSYSFAFEKILQSFPDDLNLLIKLHPNTLQKEDLKRELLQIKYETKPNIVFVNHFPAIHALIELSDIYIGDSSSIGYDFLNKKIPRYFLAKDKCVSALSSCGQIIMQESLDSLFLKIRQDFDESLYKKGFDLYQHSFHCENQWIEKIWNL